MSLLVPAVLIFGTVAADAAPSQPEASAEARTQGIGLIRWKFPSPLSLVESVLALLAGPGTTLPPPVAPPQTTPVRPPAPAAAPAPTTTTTSAPARVEPADGRCLAALRDVEATGLLLPAPFELRCPGSTEMFAGDRQHWGVTCATVSFCPNQAYVAVNPSVIGPSEARMRYVMAHEICHAQDSVAHRPASEDGADACAAAHGYPRV